MPMPGRSYQSSNSYRYGFNGQEKDLEIFEGAMTAEYWEYDSRIGRRWNRDPITYPWQSSYATFNNNPVYFSDHSGLEGNPPKVGDVDPKTGATWSTEGWVFPDVPITADDLSGGAPKPITPTIPKDNTIVETPIIIDPSIPNQGATNGDWMSELAKSIRRWESKIENTHERSFGPPIKTNFWGQTSHENGGSKGESFSSPHTSSWLAGTPGAGLYGTLKIGPVVKGKLLNSLLDYADKAGFIANADPLGPLLNNSNSEEILEKPEHIQKQAMNRNFGDTTVETNFWDPNGSNSKFYTKDINGHSVAPATEKDKIQYNSQPR